jgi:hypothetical protein
MIFAIGDYTQKGVKVEEITVVGWIKIVGMTLTAGFMLYLLKVLIDVIKEDQEGRQNDKCDLD